MKKTFIFSLLFCAAINLNAQIGLNLDKHTFIPEVKLTAEEEKIYEKDDAYCLYYGKAFDYRLNDAGQIELYEMLHFSFKIYSKDFVDDVNMFEINTSSKKNIISCGGKLTKADGKIETLGKKDITEDIDDDNDTTFLLKFPTANTGDIIEFFYVVKRKNVSTSGFWRFLASNVAVKQFDATFIMPEHLSFDVIGYNGLPNATDQVIDGTRYQCVSVQNLPKVKDEAMSFTRAHLPRVEYTFRYNYSNNKTKKLNTLDYFKDNIYVIYNEFDKKEQKALQSINSAIKVNKKSTPLEQAQQIENYVKTNFNLMNINAVVLRDFTFINKNKLINRSGCIKLLHNLFKINNIKSEIVITTDKTDVIFDAKADNGNFLDEPLLYLPDFEQYTSANENARIGLPSYFVSGCEGIIFKQLANYSVYSTEVCKIPLAAAEKSQDNIDVKIKLDIDENLIAADIKREISGYPLGFLQINLSIVDKKDYEEKGLNKRIDYYLGLGVESFNVKNIKIENIYKKDIIAKPLILSGNIEDYHDLKKSADTLAFTVGYFIGKQDPIKQDEPRTLPIERHYNVQYKRTIEVEIPDGYKCVNISDLNIEVFDSNNKTAAFVATTQLADNKIVIVCEEYYKRDFYPANETDGIINVVNAAADFNKKRLIFVKK
ncbi:MAG: hypothetical protein LBN95_04805 [Prevotellaceae bacterium]|jgi:hypothetical protein|nr:hypothetical protein [Prevotellaceae bacterium]